MDTLLEKISKVVEVMANDHIAKERFDIGQGYKEVDYRKISYFKRLMVSEDEDVVENIELIKSRLNHLKNQYL